MDPEFFEEIHGGCEKLRQKFDNFVEEECLARERMKPKEIRQANEFTRGLLINFSAGLLFASKNPKK
jgi:hypothetical protein